MRSAPATLVLLVAACTGPPRSDYVPGGTGLPSSARADYRRALEQEREGKAEEALKTLGDLCTRHPTRLGFHLRRLRLARAQWGAQRAAALYQPPPPGVGATRAEILARLAGVDEADLADHEDALRFAAEKEPAEPFWQLALADVSLSEYDARAAMAKGERGRGRMRRAEEIDAEAKAHLEAALAFAERSLELDAKFAEAHVMIGYIHTREADATEDTDARDELRTKAAASYDAALALDAEMVPALLNRSENRIYFHQYTRAIEDLEKAAALAPKEPLVWSNLGSLYYRLGQLKAARLSYESVLEIEPNDARARTALADCLRREGRTKKAVEQLNRARTDAGDDHTMQAEIAFKLGAIYEYEKRYRAAVAEYEVHISHVEKGGLPSSSASKARSRIRHIIDHAFE